MPPGQARHALAYVGEPLCLVLDSCCSGPVVLVPPVLPLLPSCSLLLACSSLAPFPPAWPPQRRPTSGDVVALGDGQVGTKQHTFELKGGETVLYRWGSPGCAGSPALTLLHLQCTAMLLV